MSRAGDRVGFILRGDLDVLLLSILPFFGILLGLIVLHEAGHYVMAKLFGVKVLEAGIGLPPKIWGFRWRGTDYTLNAIPMGAFVRMLGEEDPEAQENPDEERPAGVMNPESLAAQPKWKRTIIIGAGAFMNFVVAVVLFTLSLMISHPEPIGGAEIATVAPGSPAQNADLRPGDQIVAINGRKTEGFNDAGYLIRLHQGSTIEFTIKRDDPRAGSETLKKDVYARWNPQPHKDECGVNQVQGPTGIQLQAVSLAPVNRTPEDLAKLRENSITSAKEYKEQVAPGSPSWCFSGTGFGFVGLSEGVCSSLGDDAQAAARALKTDVFAEAPSPCYEFRPGPAFEVITENKSEPLWTAFPNATRLSFESIILTRNQIWALVRGFEGTSPVTGPVGIAQVTGEVVEQAGWLPLLTLAASISMSLALFNALPIPMVDGGRLFFILLEFLRGGKRVAPQKEALVHFAGFVALIIFALVVTYFDIMRIIGGDSILR